MSCYSNPGGFVEGVTIENILNVQPHPRNRTLADAMYRIGFVDRVGRGVDKIYRGVLRFGRQNQIMEEQHQQMLCYLFLQIKRISIS